MNAALYLDFEAMGTEDRKNVEAMCLQFTLWLALNPAEQLQRANTSTRRYKQFRNAVVLLGGKCESGE